MTKILSYALALALLCGTAYADNLTPGSNIIFGSPAAGIVLKQGSNARYGTFVANGATAVAVANTSIALTDTCVFSLNTVGGTVGAAPHMSTITAGTGFNVVATAGDTSTYNYACLGSAP